LEITYRLIHSKYYTKLKIKYKMHNVILFIFLLLVSCLNNSVREKINRGWETADEIIDNLKDPVFSEREFLLTDFGAVSDGTTDCTDSFRKAIQKCHDEGGGKIIIPPGIYLSGAIHMLSNVHMHFEEGAKILFTTNKEKYLPNVYTRFEGMECMNYSPFIYAYNQENIALTGKGILDGQGEVWWSWKGRWSGSANTDWKPGTPNQRSDNEVLTEMVANNVPVEERVFGEGHYLRPNFVQFYRCRNILVDGLILKNSPMWNIHPVLSENIIVRNVEVRTLGPNNDGCNPESSKNVLIENCIFDTGDDCIAIKSGRNEDGRRINVPSENIIVRNCTMYEGHGGVVIGSEISGNVRMVFVENCIMDSKNLERAIRIKSNSLRGGIVEDVYVRNLKVLQVSEATFKINLFYSTGRGEFYPVIRNIYLEEVHSYKSKYPLWINANEEATVDNIYLINCTFEEAEKESFIKNARNLVMENVSINGITQ
jgi:polygalacturonase